MSEPTEVTPCPVCGQTDKIMQIGTHLFCDRCRHWAHVPAPILNTDVERLKEAGLYDDSPRVAPADVLPEPRPSKKGKKKTP